VPHLWSLSNNIKLKNGLDLNDVLKTLPIAGDASFNAYQRQHDPTCLPDTRVDLLQEIYNWADGENSPSIFWLNGLAGTGKSTIARTLVKKYFDSGGIAATSTSAKVCIMHVHGYAPCKYLKRN
jgi:predicted alpha/beta-fold hydrolase